MLQEYSVSLVENGKRLDGARIQKFIDEAALPLAASQLAFSTGVIEFWSSGTTLRDIYLARLLDRALLVESLTVDSEQSELFKKAWGETVVYLDTNVAFGLLNFDGPSIFYPLQTLFDLGKQAGIQFRIAAITVKELKSTLQLQQEAVRRYPITSQQLAECAASHMVEESFLKAYNQEFASKGSTPEEFRSFIGNIELFLRRLGVEIDKLEIEKLPVYTSLREAHLAFLNGAKGLQIYQEPSPEKSNHDFQLWCATQFRRGGVTTSYAAAKAFVLTRHRRLETYEDFARQQPGEVPTQITPDRLFQALRMVMPRSDDANIARQFATLIRTNFFAVKASSGNIVIQRVASLLSKHVQHFQVADQEAANLFAVLAVDQALATEIEVARDEDEANVALNSALARAAKHATDRALAMEVALTDARVQGEHQLQVAEARIQMEQREVAALRKTITSLQEQFNALATSKSQPDLLVPEAAEFTPANDTTHAKVDGWRWSNPLYLLWFFTGRLFQLALKDPSRWLGNVLFSICIGAFCCFAVWKWVAPALGAFQRGSDPKVNATVVGIMIAVLIGVTNGLFAMLKEKKV